MDHHLMIEHKKKGFLENDKMTASYSQLNLCFLPLLKKKSMQDRFF